MLIWFAAGSVAIVWAVFQSPAIDFRMVMLGAVLPLVETPWMDGPLHTLAAPTVALALVMGVTVGRRLTRRRWLGVPIGMFLHLVLDGSWTRSDLFWWPITGLGLPDNEPLVLARGMWSLVLEVAGIGLAAWAWSQFGLDDAGRRERFLRTGQLDRAFVKEQR
jgi:hypothetical protein